tara:strand:+ start:129 stop:431 length:303 start_codon:yes stop_codon:yes gene_type:complete
MQGRFQNHPLYSTDRAIVDRLINVENPQKNDIVDCSRLFIRYEGFPGAPDLHDDLNRVLSNWGIDKAKLNEKARSIWFSGFRPDHPEDVDIGSGADITTT